MQTPEIIALDDLSSQLTIAMSAVGEARAMVTMGTALYTELFEAGRSIRLCSMILDAMKKRAVYQAREMAAGA